MYYVATTILAVAMALLWMFVRFRAAKKPATTKKIIIPPLGMSTGALMFVVPQFRVGLDEALLAFLLGSLFSVLLIKTSKFEVQSDQIYLKQSKAFIFILFGLLAIRTAMKLYLGHQISVPQTSGVFFILAFGMILPWRIAMLMSFKKMAKELRQSKESFVST